MQFITEGLLHGAAVVASERAGAGAPRQRGQTLAELGCPSTWCGAPHAHGHGSCQERGGVCVCRELTRECSVNKRRSEAANVAVPREVVTRSA